MEPAELESLLEIEDPSAEAWCSVFQRLIINRDRIEAHPETAEIICYGLLKKLEEIGCKDKYNMCKILDIFISWQLCHQIEIPDYFHLMYPIEMNFTDNDFCVTTLMKLSLEKSMVKVVNLLLNYGCLHPIDISEGCIRCIMIMKGRDIESCLLLRLHSGHVCTPECWAEFWNRVFMLDPIISSSSSNISRRIANPRGFKRILLAALCIGVLEYRNTNNAEKYYVQSLRLYFRAIADPFVQADDEFGSLLRFFLFNASKVYVDGLIQDFKRLYPESQGPYRPRSLKHLCRCAIRRNLTHRLEGLPVLLDDLGLPRYLKMYIMGDL